MPFFLLISLAWLFTSCCGYHWDEANMDGEASTISVPYIAGDPDGELTAAVVKELASSGAYSYRPCGGDLILRIALIDDYDENIGFRYDRSRKGKLKHEIIPVETRLYIVADVDMVLASTCKVVRGPIRLQATVDFDHDDYTIRNGVNTFSLGQLTDIDSAQDVAVTPLYRKLAEKIVDFVIYGW